MKCLACDAPNTVVTDSRSTLDNASIRRRRRCVRCGHRSTTFEVEGLALATSETEGYGGHAQAIRRGREFVEAFSGLTEADAAMIMHVIRRLGGSTDETGEIAA